MSEGSKVQVIVRCRPLLSKEILQDKIQKCVKFHFDKRQIIIGNNKDFIFDYIFDDKTKQEDIFNNYVKSLVEGCFLGYNATIFAYGQTGSGKTHTMGTSVELLSTEEEGIIPRVSKYLYYEIDKNHNDKVINIRLSFLEIYNEEMRDLLHPEVPSRDISIREDHLGRIFFTGAREEIITSFNDIFKFLERGTMNRSTGETLMNDASSRSHAIFTISLEIYESTIIESNQNNINNEYEIDNNNGNGNGNGNGNNNNDKKKKTTEISSYIHSKLHLVDLAGSERAKRTGAVGVRLKESVGINQGLLSLGRVIRALTTTVSNINQQQQQQQTQQTQTQLQKSGQLQNNNSMHIPYRESKLTRFLQDSLGGNSKTLMIACISPSELDIQETLTTLQYASRARAVQNKVKANISTAHIEVDTNLIDTLREQLSTVQAQLKEQQQLTSLMIAEKKERDDLKKLNDDNIRINNNSSSSNNDNYPIAEVISQQKRGIILDRLNGIQKVLQNAVKYFDNSVDVGIIQIHSDAIQSWEDVICNIHNSASILEDISGLVRESSGESVASIVESIGGNSTTPALLVKKVQALQIELAECREDLKRDEDIFSEKVAELKQTRRALKKAQEEIIRLNEVIENNVSIKQNQQSDNLNKKGKNDNLDISIAVAATEPHVSQLMEDLETISREKEKLSVEKEIAERKCAVAISLAEKQKNDFEHSRYQLSKQLKELEIGIKMKQEVISSLTREQQEISGKADMYAAHISKLEAESYALRQKLETISQESIHNDETLLEKQKLYEAKIKLAQNEISSMRKQWKKEQERLHDRNNNNNDNNNIEPPESPQVNQSKDLLEELKSMKDEHRRLRLLLEEDDAKQKQQLKILSQQMESYKKKAHDSQKQIKILESRNAELQQQSIGLTSTLPTTKSLGNLNSQKEGSYLRRHSTSSGGTPKNQKSQLVYNNPDSPPIPPTLIQSNWTELNDQNHLNNNNDINNNNDNIEINLSTIENDLSKWINDKIDLLMTARTSSEEEERIQDILLRLKNEKEKLENERDLLQKKNESSETELRLQLKEMEGRVSRISKELMVNKKEYKKKIELNQNWNGSEDEMQLKTEIAESERTLRSLREYRAELTVRLERSFLSSDEQQRLQELRDELETNEAEIQLNQLNLVSLSKNISNSPISNEKSIPTQSSILNNIKNELNSILKNKNLKNENNKILINTIINQIKETVELKLKLNTIQNNLNLLQLNFDSKNKEFEEIVIVLHRQRNEFNKKYEKQSKENEDKINYLINLLKKTELKLQENNYLLNSNPEFMMKSEDNSNNLNNLNNSSNNNNSNNQITRPKTSPELNEAINVIEQKNVEVNKLMQKLEKEIHRREILEKRNSELMKEMRKFREAK